MTNPLEEIRELAEGWKKATVISEPVTPFQLLRACSAQLLAILDASQGYVCVPVEVAYACVPVEPTEAMINAGSQAGEWGSERDVWNAMLAAAPKPGAEGER